MKRNEIFFCDLIVIKDKKEVKIKNVVWMETETHHKKMEIKEVFKHTSLGFQNIPNGCDSIRRVGDSPKSIRSISFVCYTKC